MPLKRKRRLLMGKATVVPEMVLSRDCVESTSLREGSQAGIPERQTTHTRHLYPDLLRALCPHS